MGNKIIPVVAAIIWVGNKYLLHRKVESRNPELIGKWEFPGGMMEYGESPEEALRREIREELEREIVVGQLFYAKTFIPESREHYLVLFYLCTIPDLFPIPEDCGLFSLEEISHLDCLSEVQEVIAVLV